MFGVGVSCKVELDCNAVGDLGLAVCCEVKLARRKRLLHKHRPYGMPQKLEEVRPCTWCRPGFLPDLVLVLPPIPGFRLWRFLRRSAWAILRPSESTKKAGRIFHRWKSRPALCGYGASLRPKPFSVVVRIWFQIAVAFGTCAGGRWFFLGNGLRSTWTLSPGSSRMTRAILRPVSFTIRLPKTTTDSRKPNSIFIGYPYQ